MFVSDCSHVMRWGIGGAVVNVVCVADCVWVHNPSHSVFFIPTRNTRTHRFTRTHTRMRTRTHAQTHTHSSEQELLWRLPKGGHRCIMLISYLTRVISLTSRAHYWLTNTYLTSGKQQSTVLIRLGRQTEQKNQAMRHTATELLSHTSKLKLSDAGAETHA